MASVSFWVATVFIFGSLMGAYYISSKFERPTMKVVALLLLIILVSIGVSIRADEAQQETKLPDLKGYCRGGDIEVSWRVSQEKFQRIKEAVMHDAQCDVSVIHLKVPAPFGTDVP